MNLLKYLIPHGAYLWAVRRANRRQQPPLLVDELKANKALQGCEMGRRCFILGNGPSAKGLDLSVLSGELVFSVSNGYLHRDYDLIRPQYHCVPQITYGRMAEADVVSWFAEMHERIGDAILILNETERDLVRKYDLFGGRKVHYLALRENFDEWKGSDIIDLSSPIPRIESVPVMVLMVAMYLGCKQINLLGVDHDHFLSGAYAYAFELGVQQGKDYSVTNGGEIAISRYDDFQSLARLWRQYRVLRRIAESNDVSLVNATPGGALDEFPRVPFSSLFEARQ